MTEQPPHDWKLHTPADMAIGDLPPVSMHPGVFIRTVLMPDYGVNVAKTARLIGMDRASLHKVLTGQSDVTRQLAYKFGALMNDHVADLLIAYQLNYSLQHEAEQREAVKASINRLPPPASD